MAGYAFAIWGLIYFLLTIFVVYQALPMSAVPDRNNNLIFNTIGWLVPVNFLLNSLWLFIFQTNCKGGFTFGTVIIVALDVTCIMIMYYSLFVTMPAIELIGLRCGFSIYAGWVNSATILNFAHMFKSFELGLFTPDYEVRTTTVITWMAFCMYVTAGIIFRNPLFCLVFIHVLNALRVQTKKDETKTNTKIMLVIYGLYVVGITVWLIIESQSTKGASFGLFK